MHDGWWGFYKQLVTDVDEDGVEQLLAFLGDSVEFLVEQIASDFFPIFKIENTYIFNTSG